MPRNLRLAILLALLAVTAGTGMCSYAVRGSANRADELALSGLGFEIFVALLALSLATFTAGGPGPGTTGRVLARLGLGPGRLGPRPLALLVVGTLGISHGLDGILEATGLRAESAMARLDLDLQGIRGRSLALVILGLGLAPGVAEELLCRGFVQRGIERRLGPLAGILIAAVFFGALHVEPVHAAFAAILGLYLGLVAWLAGSVRAPMLCHAVNNLAALMLAALGGAEANPTGAGGLLAAWGVAGLALWAVWRKVDTSLQPRRTSAMELEDPAAPPGSREALQKKESCDDA